MGTCLMGIDAGGGGVRCLVVDQDGTQRASAERVWSPHPDLSAGPFALDLDHAAFRRAFIRAVREATARSGVVPRDVAAIGVTGMRLSTVLLNGEGEVLFAVPNRDGRAASESSELAQRYGWELNQRTGHWPFPASMAARLLWLRANRAEALLNAAHVLGLAEWLVYLLTGVAATEASLAAETLLLDVATGDWADDVVGELGVSSSLLPPVCRAGAVVGSLSPRMAEELGLTAGTPVILAGADTQCALLAVGCSEPGMVGIVAGSTLPVQLVTSRPWVDTRARVWTAPHVRAGRWVLEANAGAAGDVVEWFADALYPEATRPVAHLLAEAGLAAPGAGGVFSSFGAAIMNARELSFPVGTLALSHMDEGALGTRRARLARGLIEGMAYAIRANVEQLRAIPQGATDAGSNVAGEEQSPGAGSVDPVPREDAQHEVDSEIFMVGGLTRSSVWRSVVAEVMGVPVHSTVGGQVSALGAALMAGAAVGLRAGREMGTVELRTEHVAPEAGRSVAYRRLYCDWRRLGEARAPADELVAEMAVQDLLARTPAATEKHVSAPALRILATADIDESSREALSALGTLTYAPYRETLRLLTGDDLVEALQGYDVFITEVDLVEAEALRSLPQLRVLATCRGQAVNVDVEACTALGIPVLFTPGRNAGAVADLTLAFMLALRRRLKDADAFLRLSGGEEGDMGRMGQAHAELRGRELWGSTVGLAGLGAVGREVAKRLRPFGATLLVADPHVTPEQAALVDAELVSLTELLARSDVVSLHAAVTTETRGLLGATELAQMKEGAVLINTARAALVDEAALVAALESGHLGGAAVDVFETEPPSSHHPLLALPNVLATPHQGGNTVEVAVHQGSLVVADLARMARGEAPLNILNPESLVSFDWRRERHAAGLSEPDVRAERTPSVTDLRTPVTSAGSENNVAADLGEGEGGVDGLRAQMQRVLEGFLDRAGSDPALLEFATGRDLTTQYTVTDLGLDFSMTFLDGVVIAGLGAPARPAQVRMKAKAEVLDGILTGRINGNRAAMSGKLAFMGDVRLAMGMQRIQADMVRLYAAAREDAGGLDFSAAATVAGAAAPLGADRAAQVAVAAGSPGGHTAAGDGACASEAQGRSGPSDELTAVVAELFAAGLFTATGGNASLRDSQTGHVWITPSQVSKGTLRAEHMVCLDDQGNALNPDAPAPSSEWPMHLAIYKVRPDVEAVVHAHATYATILGLAGIPFSPITAEAAFFKDIPRVPFIMPGSRELAVATAKALGDGAAVLLQNHGLVTVAGSLRRAADVAGIVERVSELIWGCHAVGKKPPVLPKEMVALLQEIGRLTV